MFPSLSSIVLEGKNFLDYKVTVIMLTWQRIQQLPVSLHNLARQTNKNFDLVISNANSKYQDKILEYTRNFKPYFPIKVRLDSNREFAYRRLKVARDCAKSGTDIVLFIDDDVNIPPDYVEKAIKQYEPHSYKSQFAWKLDDGGSDYYGKRTRVFDKRKRVNYCGTGVSMVDASIFLNKGLFDSPAGAIKVEDLWLSYYAQHVLDWKLQYMDIKDVEIGGADRVALYKSVSREKYNKADFLRDLVKMGWKL